MKKTLVALFLLVAFGGFAAEMKHNWFDLDVDDFRKEEPSLWPTGDENYIATECFVTNTSNASVVGGNIVIGNDGPVYAVVTKSAPVNDDNYAYFQLSMKFDTYETLPALRDDVSFGVIAHASGGETNFWVAVAGDSPCWSNTLIAADVEINAAVSMTVSNGVGNATFADWTFNSFGQDRHFVYPVGNLTQLDGPIFLGTGRVSDCWGSIISIGVQVEFFLSNGQERRFDDDAGQFVDVEIALPVEIEVSITNSHGTAITPDPDSGIYSYSEGKSVYITYKLTNGWVFCDTGLSETTEVFKVETGRHIPFGEIGIWERDYGEAGGWLLLWPEGDVYARTNSTEGALSLLYSSVIMTPCYREPPHAVVVDDSGAMTIDGCKYEAPERRYYYQQEDGSVGVAIDDCEFGITSFGENPTNSSEMVIGTIEDTYDGFGYYIEWARDLDFSDGYGYSVESAIGGGKLTLGAPKGEDGKRFYRIGIFELEP